MASLGVSEDDRTSREVAAFAADAFRLERASDGLCALALLGVLLGGSASDVGPGVKGHGWNVECGVDAAAIELDGLDVVIFGCSRLGWKDGRPEGGGDGRSSGGGEIRSGGGEDGLDDTEAGVALEGVENAGDRGVLERGVLLADFGVLERGVLELFNGSCNAVSSPDGL